MKIQREDIVKIISLIKANYTYAYRDIDTDTMKLLIETWFSSLSKYDKRIVNVAFKRALENCKVPPTLADILNNIKDIVVTTEPSDTELWQQLVKAASDTADCTYYFRFNLVEENGKTQGENARARFNEIWNKLPQVLKDYCGNKDGLITLSETDMSYEKSRFLRVIPSIRERQEIKQTTSPTVLAIASVIAQRFGNEDSLDNKKVAAIESSRKDFDNLDDVEM